MRVIPAALDSTHLDLTRWLAEYLVDYRTRDLDDELRERVKRHLLDSLVAVISGSAMTPGMLAQKFVSSRAARGRARVAGLGIRTSPEMAALANGMSAHSDETDDLCDLAQVHPGAAVVPAAIAAAEDAGMSGERLLRGVSAGYDVAIGMNLTAWEAGDKIRKGSAQASNAVGQLFGAAAAASVIGDLTVGQLRQVLSYAAQQAAGINSFHRDPDHIEKAFDMGGQGAHNGVLAVELVKGGFTGVSDILDGSPGYFDAWGIGGDRTQLAKNVDRRHVFNTDMKQFPVGGPILAAAQALKEILVATHLEAEEVESVEARLPAVKAWIVDGRDMPNINLQYCLAVMLADGNLNFENSHDVVRPRDPRMRDLMAKVTLVADPDLNPPPSGEHGSRRAVVRVQTLAGQLHEVRVDPVLGSAANPFNWDAVEEKAVSVLASVMAEGRVRELAGTVRGIESCDDLAQLTRFFVPAQASL